MISTSFLRTMLLATFLTTVVAQTVTEGRAKDIVSAKMAVPLKKAEQLMKQGKYVQADAAIKEAASLSNKTAYERDIIEQLRIASAVKQNKVDDAIQGYTHLIASNRTTNIVKINMIMAQASLAYRAKKYPEAVQFIQNYMKAGGDNPHMRTLLIQSYFLNNNYKEALQEQKKQIDYEVKNGQTPAESQWQIMANCQQKLGDHNGLRQSYIQLATHYPKPEYWSQVMSSLASTSGMTSQVELEIWRFRFDAGLLKTSDQYITMTEIAVQAGVPHLGLNVLSQGYTKGILGADKNTGRVVRLRNYITTYIQKNQKDLTSQIATEQKSNIGDVLLMIGYDQVARGKSEGITLMKSALTKQLTDHNMALLHYAMAEIDLGQKEKAVITLKSIRDQDGVAGELAQLWLMRLRVK